MELYILRHGRAGKKIPDGGSDAERQLTGKGRDEVKKIARWLRISGIRFDKIATSPLARAVETAEIVATELESHPGPEAWESLQPGSDPDHLKDNIRAAGSLGALLIVGHEPLLSTLIGGIIADRGTARVLLRKGGLAVISELGKEEPMKGRLYRLLDPGCFQEPEV